MVEILKLATRNQPYFTVEDFRELGLHEDLRHPNAIGQFFKQLADKGYAEACGVTRATHPEANKRWVFRWRWLT